MADRSTAPRRARRPPVTLRHARARSKATRSLLLLGLVLAVPPASVTPVGGDQESPELTARHAREERPDITTDSDDRRAPLQPTPTGFPDAVSTGVPEGVNLTPSESLTITEDGAVVDALHVRGRITIKADDVTIRNTLIQGGGGKYPIHVQEGATGALIDHVEIDNLGDTGIGIFFNGGSGTVRHTDIHSAEDGIRIQANDVTVEFSYIHDLTRLEGGHHDAVQIRSGNNVTIRGNNLQAYVPSTDDPMNAAIQIGSLSGDTPIANLLVVGNLMNGGNYTINGGGEGVVDSARYSANKFGRDARYGPVTNLGSSMWESSNVWLDTEEPVR